jgi:hypothetical protein
LGLESQFEANFGRKQNVDTMIAMGISLVAIGPNMTETTALATRSSGAVWICGSVSGL